MRYWWLLFGILLGLGGGVTAQAAPLKRGLILDAARQYYSPASLRQVIREVHQGGGTFLQLHLTDDSRYGIESTHLGQTVQAARKQGTTYYNRQTGKAFLSKRQLRALVVYGHQRKVEVIPEIDTPAHATALIHLLKTSGAANQRLAKQIATTHELRYSRAATQKFVKSLLHEYTGLLYRGQHLAIGGDEFSASMAPHQPATVRYVNALNCDLRRHHLKTMLWNDGLMTADLKAIDHNILVTYWSYDGEQGSTRLATRYRQLRASLPALNRAGFQTINANFWYLYVITRPRTFTAHNQAYWQNDLKTHWNPQVWDKTNHRSLATSSRNVGTALSIWGDGKRTYSQKQILSKTQPFLTSYFRQAR